MDLLDFLSALSSNYILLITVLLVLSVVLINGWTDAPNAIATCISTRAITPKNAVIMAAIFNFLGVLTMAILSPAIAQKVFNLVDFGGDSSQALVALCAALVGILIWAIGAWAFGIPTSESHALIAGLSGAAIALQGGFNGINGGEWMSVVYGLLLSTFLGFGSGFGLVLLIKFICKDMNRKRTKKFFRGAQVAGGAAMAFVHGAQDGLKFMSVFMLGVYLSQGSVPSELGTAPIWLIIIVSAVMALGTSIGGYRIIKTVGMDLVKLKDYQGFASDVAAAGCILLSSLTGLPVSTTHTKSTSIMGVGAANRLSTIKWDVVRDMSLTWILTFPGCGLIGFLMAKLFILIF